jgi:hypothetical protein
LRRFGDAHDLLVNCRAMFEAERDVAALGSVYGALAELERRAGHQAAAVRFVEVGLGYAYKTGEPENCATGHHNLASDLDRAGAESEVILFHRVAAATIYLQIQSGGLSDTVYYLANSDLPPAPPPFDEVAQQVEAIEGVRFRELFDRLPRTAPTGDAAIAAIWQKVAGEKRRRDEHINQVLRESEPMLQQIAAAMNDESLRADIEPLLADGEQKGWRLTEAVRRIWAGERDAETLTTGIDLNSARLIRCVLELLGQ